MSSSSSEASGTGDKGGGGLRLKSRPIAEALFLDSI